MASPTSRPRSRIWYHFEKLDSQEGAKGVCRYCKAIIKMTGGSTSNLRRHLTKKHVTIPLDRTDPLHKQKSRSRSPSAAEEEIEVDNLFKEPVARPHGSPSPVPTSSSFSTPTPSVSPLSISTPSPQLISQSTMMRFVDVIKPIPINKSRQIDVQLLKMICSEYHPFSIVEDKEFQTFVHLLCPNYQLPSRKTLSNSLLNSVHDSITEKIVKVLEEAHAVCLTCDGWTSINTTSFLALTAHFISNGRLSSVLLQCSEFPEKYTGENISYWIKEASSKFKVDFKIAAIVTDNAANMKAAVKTLALRHISCFAHSLNLVVQGAIASSIQSTVDKVKLVVQYFKQSSHAATKLREMQTSLNKNQLKLKQDVPTRWNSTFDMLERIEKNREPIISVLAVINAKLLLNDKDWKVIAESVELLKVFFEVTEEISAEKNVSLSKTSILSRGMAKCVRRTMDNLSNMSDEVRVLGSALLEGLTKRFGNRESSELISQSVFLDPRFKRQGFGEISSFEETKRGIVQKLQSVMNASPINVVAPEQVPKPPTTSSIWEEFDASVHKLKTVQDVKASALIEIDKYLAEPIIDRHLDPVVWWQERKTIFPNLYQLMLKRLCIPATSVPCERLFSKAGNIYTHKRSQLTSSKVTKMLFLNHNSDFVNK